MDPVITPKSLIANLRKRRAIVRALTGTMLGDVTIQLSVLVTGVIVARALGPVDRGHFAFLTLVASLLWQLCPLGVPFALTYVLARMPTKGLTVVRQLRTSIAVQLIAATVLATIVLAVLTADRPHYVQTGAALVLGVVAPWILFQYCLSILQGLRRFTPFNILRAVPTAAFASIAAALFLTGQTSFTEITLAWVASQVILVPIALRLAWHSVRAAEEPNGGNPPSRSWVMRFGRRSILGASFPSETYRIDQVVVALVLSPSALGLYVVALAFTRLPRFVARSIGIVANPAVASSSDQDEARKKMWRFVGIVIPACGCVTVLLWLFSPRLVTWFFGAEFSEASSITRLLLIATMFYCARRVLSDGARGAGYPGLATVAELVGLIAQLPLFAVFVPAGETKGVAYALIGSSTIAFAVLAAALLIPSLRRAVDPGGWLEREEPAVASASSGKVP